MALDFNGSSDQVSFGDIALDAATQVTVSAWARADTLGDFESVWQKYSSTTNRIGFGLSGSGFGDNNEFIGYLGNGSNNFCYTTGQNLWSTGTWHHVLMCYDGGGSTNADKLKVWFNGTQLSLTYRLTVASSLGTHSGALVVGSRGGGDYWDGQVAEVAVWAGGTPGGVAGADVGAVAHALWRGDSPSRYRKNGLHFWPLYGKASPEVDLWGTATGTLTGTSAYPHPPLRRRRASVFVPKAAAVAPGGFSPYWSAARSGIIGAGAH